MQAYHAGSVPEQSRMPRWRQRQIAREERRTWQGRLALLARESLTGMSITLGIDAFEEMAEQEAESLCGAPRGKHAPGQREAYLHGSKTVEATLAGKRVTVTVPRVRGVAGAGERALQCVKAAEREDLLTEAALAQCLHGVSQRGYRGSLHSLVRVPEGAVARGDSRSAVSRRFITATEQRMAAFLKRPLGDRHWLVLFIDGVHVGDQQILTALGLDEHGGKLVLGLHPGCTESAAECEELLTGLAERGLCADEGLLVVIDGGKGLAKAVTKVLGRARIQRCHQHKIRNVQDHLPEDRREWLRHRMMAAWAQPTAPKARAAMQRLRRELRQAGHDEAAASLREGLGQTLTCHELGVAADLRRILVTTNPIESPFARCERLAKRVCRWHPGQALRWAATALELAEQAFRPVNQPEALAELAAALQRGAAQTGLPA